MELALGVYWGTAGSEYCFIDHHEIALWSQWVSWLVYGPIAGKYLRGQTDTDEEGLKLGYKGPDAKTPIYAPLV